jgi:hypothetical protein
MTPFEAENNEEPDLSSLGKALNVFRSKYALSRTERDALIKNNLEAQAVKMKRIGNRKKLPKFEIGDYVIVESRKRLKNKGSKYIGIGHIIEVNEDLNLYKFCWKTTGYLESHLPGTISSWISVNYLKKYYPSIEELENDTFSIYPCLDSDAEKNSSEEKTCEKLSEASPPLTPIHVAISKNIELNQSYTDSEETEVFEESDLLDEISHSEQNETSESEEFSIPLKRKKRKISKKKKRFKSSSNFIVKI